MLTEDQILWGAALMLLRRHGDRAPLEVAVRIGELAEEGDAAGVALWRAIARRVDDAMKAGTTH